MKIPSLQSFFSDAKLRNIIVAGIGLILLFMVGMGALFVRSSELKTVVGEVKAVDSNLLIVSRHEDADLLPLAISSKTIIRRNENPASSGVLQPGDSLRVKYETGWRREDLAVEILAKSPFIKGRLIDIDLRDREIVVKGFSVRLFKVTEQTVILRDGSLLKLKGLERGLMVRAEFSGTDRPKLEKLTVIE